jgi:hypothetical protein
MAKKICALTMVRNDEFFLRKWVEYYSSQLGSANLYVYFDGQDQVVPDFCNGVNVSVRERVPGMVAAADRGRIDFLSEQASQLLEKYDMVIGTDVDEFLVVDPQLGKTLPEFLSELPDRVSYSGLGIDVGQHLDKESDIDSSVSFLRQRHYARLSTRYSKSSVITKPVRWGSGFHRVRSCNFKIVKDLYLFHFGCVDMGRLQAKLSDKDKIDTGWERHLKKRARTIYDVTEGTARPWNSWVRKARWIQNFIRPPYAWNKPAMFNAVVIVRIPERFESII